MRKRFIRRTVEETRRKRFGGHIKRIAKKGLATAARGTVHGISSGIGGLAVAAVVWWFQTR
ncbi:hypothetical protein [Streptomyces formicae]|uniref:Uncharacterized protein n=1 Tax=Streptomyces formicae TaxID=1616117 RepID=A0ABY3WCX6_9ACTN|nr:hypothetical protein [Streptomyces formicae]UNM10426.1 hypothetical protein J4032_01900 [Streptomyces formicae]